MAKKGGATIAPVAAPSISSLGEALRARGIHVGEDLAAPPAPAPQAETDLSRHAKLVVRRERKGHGGKTVTVIEGLVLTPIQTEALAQRMRRALGCGAWVDGGRVLLQGDLAPTAAAWLRANGATRVVQGN